MPRYYFDVQDGVSRPDPDGSELPDVEAARREVIDFAGHILRDYARDVLTDDTWRLQVLDDERSVVFQIDVAVTFRPPGS